MSVFFFLLQFSCFSASLSPPPSSRHLHELTSSPKLWTSCQPSRRTVEQVGLQALLGHPRLALLSHLDLSYLDLRGEAQATLASLPSRLASLRLRYTSLAPGHLQALLVACVSTKARGLVSLDLDSVPLGEVSSDLLAKALAGRTEAGLANTGLTTDQVPWLHLECLPLCDQVCHLLASLPSSSLTSLSLASLDLRGAGQPLVCLAALTLTTLDLANCLVLPEHLGTLLQTAIWSTRSLSCFSCYLFTQPLLQLPATLPSPSLEALDLSGADLSEVSGHLLADSAQCLSSLSLCGARLEHKQLQALLQVGG